MTKEQLEKLGLDDNQITEVFKLNGMAIEKTKSKAEQLEEKLVAVDKQLKTANEQIDKFTELDFDQVKKAADEYKDLYEKEKSNIEKLSFNHELDKLILKKKGRNTKAIKALLDVESLRDKDKEDLEKALDGIVKENDYLFESEEPKGTGGGVGNTSKDKKPDPKVNYGSELAKGKSGNQTTDTSNYEL